MTPFRGRYLWLRLFASYRVIKEDDEIRGVVQFRAGPVKPWLRDAARRAVVAMFARHAKENE